jgi:multidrug resistance efflux pump
MRAFGALLWLVVLGFCAYNWWQIRELKSELASQRAAVRVSERSPGLLEKMQRALGHGERARKLLAEGKQGDARKELDRAMTEFTDAARNTDADTAARLHQIEEALGKVREQTQDLLHHATPGKKHDSRG